MDNNSAFSFNKRYLVIGTLIYIISSYIFLSTYDISDFQHSPIRIYSLIFALVIVVASLVLCLSFRKNKTFTTAVFSVMTAVLIFVVGYTESYTVASKLYDNHNLVANNPKVCGIITSTVESSSSNKSYHAEVDIFTLSNEQNTITLKKPIKAIVYIPSDHQIPNLGDSVAFDYSFELGGEPSYSGAFSYKRYLKQKKICYSGYTYNLQITDVEYNQPLTDKFKRLGINIRSEILKSCDLDIYNPNEKQLLEGVLLGNVAGFSDELYESYTDSGLIHIASVSGMHTSYLFLLISCLLLLTRLPKRFYAFAAIPVLILFASISLFTPSVCRAVVMLSVLLIAQLLGRPNDSITALSLSALILVFDNPYCLESYSFILSFGATLGILIFSTPLTNSFSHLTEKLCPTGSLRARKLFTKSANYILGSVAVSIAGTVGTAYFSARFFGQIAWGGIFANVLIFPTVAIIFICGYTNCAIFKLFPALAGIIAEFILNPTLRLTNKIAEIFSHRIFSVQVPIPQKLFFVIYILIFLYIYLVFTQKSNTDHK